MAGGPQDLGEASLPRGGGLGADMLARVAARLGRIGDDGPGIPSRELERIFEPFHRADRSHPRPGTGVGLALVASFAARHGGRAWAEPTSEGAHLVVELPGSAPDPAPAAATTGA